ncbi:hypothetical protein [Dickeya zeae]|uniref:hypothetical protein n=1 Tax=Dickeya zeae TaxID=204042 RepID=UPI0018F8591C|nr:hypothetical protein [Dickeya zeae]
MTWVVGGNCFNGYVCVADIQVTIQRRGECDLYYNCVQKIHQISSNLCVAFSGDIRAGLSIIAEITYNLSLNMKENEYFDIDGQSSTLITLLQQLYQELYPGLYKPYVEFMFLWNAQEGDEIFFRPFCMKFKSPMFNMNSIPVPGLAQTGSGINNNAFNAITSFLTGKMSDSDEYQRIFSGITAAPNLVTVTCPQY